MPIDAGSFAHMGMVLEILNEAVPVTINQAAGTHDPTVGGLIYFTVQFQEAMTGFTGADVDLSNSTAGGTLTALVTGSGADYTVVVTGMTSNGFVIAELPAAIATSVATGAPNEASTSTDNSIYWYSPANLSLVNSILLNPTAGTGFDVSKQDDYCYVSISTNSANLQHTVVDVSDVYDLTIPARFGTGQAFDNIADGNYLYTITGSTLQVHDIDPPTSPSAAVETLALGGSANAQQMMKVGNYLYIPVSGTVNVIDISNPLSVSVATTFSAVAGDWSKLPDSDYAYLLTTSGPVFLEIWDVSNPLSPTRTDQMSPPRAYTAIAIDISDDYIYVGDTAGNFVVVDVSDKTAASQVGSVAHITQIGSSINGIVVDGDYCYGTGFAQDRVFVIGIANKASPAILTSLVVFDQPSDIAKDDGADFLYVVSRSGRTLNIVEINALIPVINQGSSQESPTTDTTIVFDLVFPEAVAGLTTADIILSGTAGATTVAITGTGPSYTVEVTGMTGPGTVIATVQPRGVTSVATGKVSGPSSSSDNSVYWYDTVDNAIAAIFGSALVFSHDYEGDAYSSATASDISGNGRTGDYQNIADADTQSGPGGTYPVWNADADSVEIADAAALSITGALGISYIVLVRPTGTAQMALASKQDGASTWEYLFDLRENASSQWKMSWENYPGTATLVSRTRTSSVQVPASSWSLLAACATPYNSSGSANCTMYRNGAPLTVTKTLGTSNSPANTSAPVRVGWSGATGYAFGYRGSVARVICVAGQRSAAEMLLLGQIFDNEGWY